MENIEVEQNSTPDNSEAQLPESPKKRLALQINKKALIITVAFIGLLAVAYWAKGFFIAAVVNGQPISRWTVLHTLEKESGKDLLESLILEQLIAQEARERQLVVSDEELATEIAMIKEQITAQGGDFEQALAQQGMTVEVLEKQILLQKQVEKLLADKVAVTDEEINQYLTDSQTVVPEGQEASFKEQVRSQLVNQKLNSEAPAYIDELKAQSNIKYFVHY